MAGQSSGLTSYVIYPGANIYFAWNIKSQDIATRTSVINWRVYIECTASHSQGSLGFIDQSPVNVEINGSTYSKNAPVYTLSRGKTVELFSGTTSVIHDSDGTKTLSISWDHVIYSGHWEYDANYNQIVVHDGYVACDAFGVETATLPKIDGKSTITVEGGTLGVAQTLTVKRDSTDFVHTITYKCGTASGTICTESSNTSVTFTPPISLASQNPTGANVSIVYTITTYMNTGVNLGSTSITETCAIPESVVPSLSIAVSDPMGYADRYGYYIQKKSKIGVTILAVGAYGSTISAYKTEANGKTYAAASVETDVITGSGMLYVTATVTDTRGRQASAEAIINVAAYSAPGITELSVRRTTADGTSSTSGGYLTITFDSAVTALDGRNSAIYTLQYKKASEVNYTSETILAYSGQHSVNDGTYTFAAPDKASSYNLILTVADDFGSTYRIAVGSPAQRLFSILFRGLGLAFGKNAELEGVLDIGFQTKFTGGIMHPMLESETNLDDVLTPNTYTGKLIDVTQYVHTPVQAGVTVKGFVFEVISAGDDGELMQRMTVFTDSGVIVYHRLYSGGVWAATWT